MTSPAPARPYRPGGSDDNTLRVASDRRPADASVQSAKGGRCSHAKQRLQGHTDHDLVPWLRFARWLRVANSSCRTVSIVKVEGDEDHPWTPGPRIHPQGCP